MPTPRFNANILSAARRLKDARTLADASVDTGRRYSSALLSAYENRVIRDILRDTYSKSDVDFGDVIPEYVLTSGALTLTAGSLAKPVDAWHFLTLAKSDYTVLFLKIRGDITRIIAGKHGFTVPSETRPVFWEEGVNLLTKGITTGDVLGRYISAHIDIVVDGLTDIKLNLMWDGEIVDRMVDLGLKDAKANA